MGLKKILKKVVKKAAKPAALIGAAYLASKGLGKKYNTSSVSSDNARGSNLRNILKSAMPGNLSKSAGATGPAPYKKINLGAGQQMNEDGNPTYFAKGGRAGYNKGGGVATHGLGRAFTKGNN
jgi:hypothetical protein|tara:strand:+ start:56 stop:424 length:369 start_codon:yes stop_codon:yes gene_type:complete